MKVWDCFWTARGNRAQTQMAAEKRKLGVEIAKFVGGRPRSQEDGCKLWSCWMPEPVSMYVWASASL